jgi:hypothetical protein
MRPVPPDEAKTGRLRHDPSLVQPVRDVGAIEQ